jgi:hypothetical protein
VRAVLAHLQSVLAAVLDDVGLDRARAETSVEPAQLNALQAAAAAAAADPVTGLTLSDAASILALATPFPATEVRGRLRDDLLVAMSREPVDRRTLAQRYDLGDPAALQRKIEGTEPLSLREYARLRVVLPATRR